MAHRVETVARIGDHRVHRFQVVRERLDDGAAREWVVVGIGGGTVEIASPDFEWTRSVPDEAFESEGFEPLTAEGVPVWGY